MSSEFNADPFPLKRSSGVLLAVAMVGIATTGLVLKSIEMSGQMLVSQAIGLSCLGVSLFSLLPVWWMSRKARVRAAQGFMIGVLLRLLLGGAVFWVMIAVFEESDRRS